MLDHLAPTVKIAFIAVFTLIASAGGWVMQLAAEATATADPVGTLIPAAALTGTSGALVWVVKQIVSGNLVHRDPATATQKLAETVDHVAELAIRSQQREEILTDLLIGRQPGRRDADT